MGGFRRIGIREILVAALAMFFLCASVEESSGQTRNGQPPKKSGGGYISPETKPGGPSRWSRPEVKKILDAAKKAKKLALA